MAFGGGKVSKDLVTEVERYVDQVMSA